MLKSRYISEFPQFSGSINGSENLFVQKGSASRKVSLQSIYDSASLSVAAIQLSSSLSLRAVRLESTASNLTAASASFSELIASTEPIFADVTIGGVNAGETLPTGITVEELMLRIFKKTFYPSFVLPTVSLQSSIGTSVEAGTIGLSLTASYSSGSIVGKTVSGIWDPLVIQNGRAGAITSFIIDGTNTGTTNNRLLSSRVIGDGNNVFSVTASYATGPQPVDSSNAPYLSPLPSGSVNNTATVVGRRRCFYGVNSAATNSSQIRSLSNSILNPSNGTTFTINIPSGATSVVFSYPSTLRDVTSVVYVEGLNAEVKSIFNLTTVSVEGASGFSPINYKTYRYVPSVPFPSSATYNVTI